MTFQLLYASFYEICPLVFDGDVYQLDIIVIAVLLEVIVTKRGS